MAAEPLQLLKFKNAQLGAQLMKYREEVAAHERTNNSLKRKQASYEDRISVVTAEWNILNEDVAALAARIGSDQPSTSASATVSVKDAFLQRLLETSGRKRMRADNEGEDEDEEGAGGDDDAKKAMDALKSRSQATKAALAKVLEAIDAARAKSNELTAKMQSGGLAPEDIKAHLDSAARELEVQRRRAEALEVANVETKDELEELRAGNAKWKERNRQLTDQLDNMTADLELMRRQLAAARNNAYEQLPGLPPMATADGARAAAAGAAVAAAAANSGGGGTAGTPGPGSRPGAGAGGASEHQVLRLNSEVSELHARLEHANRATAEEQRQKVEQEKKLRTLQDALGDINGLAVTSGAYKALEQQLGAAQQDVQQYKQALERLQRELEQCKGEMWSARIQAQKGHEHMRRATLLDARVADAQARYNDIAADRDKLLHQMSADAESAGRRKLNEERRLMLDSLRRENGVLQQQAAKLSDARRSADEAERRAHDFEAALATARAEAADLRRALDAARAGVAGSSSGQHEMEEKVAEQRRATEVAESRVKRLEEELEGKNAEVDAFMAELEAIGQAYEDVQAQNSRLMDRLTERDDNESRVGLEKVQALNQAKRLREEKERLESQVTHERNTAAEAAEHVRRLEQQCAEGNTHLAKAREEAAALGVQVDAQKRQLRDAEAAAAASREAIQCTQQQNAELSARSKGEMEELEKERARRISAEEQVTGLKKKCERLVESGSTAELQQEINAYRTMMQCQVCMSRQKAVVITKCYHLFCRECIDKRIQNRDRKCPGCGNGFSAAEVHNIYF